jgi:glutamine amidotransferase PdxT
MSLLRCDVPFTPATLLRVHHHHPSSFLPLQVEVLAEYQLRAEEAAAQGGRSSVAVAVRQGPLLATAFHPELTKDLRW